jgi:aspartate/methionine/tyrosine aminotransferase
MNPRLTAIAPSLIRDLHGRKRPTSIDLGLGEPTLQPDLGPLRTALAWVEQNGCPYSPNPGLPELRAAVARYHAYPGLGEASQVGITVGSQEALAVAIAALADPAHDEALVIEPAYPLYGKLCALFGVRVRTAALDPADGFTPRAAPVLAAMTEATRILVLASPANPTGRTWSAEELGKLAEGLRARGGAPVYIVSDEVYRELYYGDAPPTSPAAVWPLTVVVGSLSKSCALTGLRVGWFLAPTAVAPELHKAHQFLVSSTTTYGQRAAIEIFARPELLRAHRPLYVARREALLDALGREGLAHIAPDGAFYCLVRLHGPLAADSTKLALAFLDQKDTVIIPGAAFGAEGWARLSFVGDPELVREGVARLAAFMRG